jgi:fructose-1,6-bisphosphatase I
MYPENRIIILINIAIKGLLTPGYPAGYLKGTCHCTAENGGYMKLADFLVSEGTEKNLAEVILFLGEQALVVKKGFLGAPGKSPADKKTHNVYGEEQMPLDKFADSVFIHGLKERRLVRYIATEEQGQVIEIESPRNNFGAVFDPLDGSSLIDVNLSIGTIIGIYPGHVLDKGSHLVAALYILYGPLTTLTYTTGKGVHEFVEDGTGAFVLRQRDLRMPEGKIYAPGALRKDYLPAHARWIEHLEQSGYKLRFSGCFVADVHQILHKGGVFTYPGIRGKENGKLRLLYEANPMGRLITEAGGAVSNGKSDILALQPASIDQITPVYIGGKKEIALIEKFMREG